MTQRIVDRVAELKLRFGTSDPFELCRCLGISVLETDLGPRLSGFYTEQGGRRAIVLSSSLTGVKKTACAAHELGHAVLHRGMNTLFLSDCTNLVVGRYEREADLFAAALLLCDGVLENFCNIGAVSEATGISRSAVEQWLGAVKLMKSV